MTLGITFILLAHVLVANTYLILPSKPPYLTQSPLEMKDLRCERRESTSSIERRAKKAIATASTPLSQRWYKNKQQHVSKAQKAAIRDYWPVFGIDLKYGVQLNPVDVFKHLGRGDDVYCVLDIGFGTGDSIVQSAVRHPDKMYIGCEIHRSGIGATILKILQAHNDYDESGDSSNSSSSRDLIGNIRLIRADVHMLLASHLVPNSLDEVCIYFPDPWFNEERDINRRIVRSDVLALLSTAMKDNGMLKIVTDVEYYADHCKKVMGQQTESKTWHLQYEATYEPGTRIDEHDDRPITKYEIRAGERGHLVHRLDYRMHKSVVLADQNRE